jgi:hypothetical protein
MIAASKTFFTRLRQFAAAPNCAHLPYQAGMVCMSRGKISERWILGNPTLFQQDMINLALVYRHSRAVENNSCIRVQIIYKSNSSA